MPSTVYVGNLDWNVDSNELFELCTQFGDVRHAQVIQDHDTGQSRGFGFVELPDDSAAEKLIEALQSTTHRGRELAINKAKHGRHRVSDDLELE